ncbi:MAG: hypothetical protein LBG27_04890 [Spirochaetaceae bacterium]|jgi:hypothetical protein|nr:hypothetical protein [Spirochaetaceae bacterium]
MANYSGIQKEETLKSLVHEDYFPQFGYEPNIDNIDFVITDKKARDDLFSDGPGSSRHYLWAEAKKGIYDVYDMFTQLILTCKKTYEKGEHLAPPWLGCFDEARISFVSFHDILPIFIETDFNWNTTPSNHETADFKKARKKVEDLIGAKVLIYNFESDDEDIKEFIKTHFTTGGTVSTKAPITKDNFVQVFIKWVKEVKPSIDITKEEWADFNRKGIPDYDFYRADVLSEGGNTITDRLKIVLENDNYKFHENIGGRLFSAEIKFKDKGEAYVRFWNKYERPPAEIYQKYIIDRRDLLAPRNIREVKGSFFTPKVWADKSKEYLAAVFGENWQDEYYIWDCAAGTGNLLAGLTNKYNIWASDVEEGNVETIQSLIDIDENLNLLPSHVFQFDFLNDYLELSPTDEIHMEKMRRDMAKLETAGLKTILDDPEKRKKLIIYINPPYAEAGNQKMPMGGGDPKIGVSTHNKAKDRYLRFIGAATNELSAQFMARIYDEIPGCKLAVFSKLKFVCTQNFIKFRKFFNAAYKGGFAVRANTFDNVQGKFPIAFTVWDLNGERFPEYIDVDIPEDGGRKRYWDDFNKSINHWIRTFDNPSNGSIGLLICESPDFQKIHQPYLTLLSETRKSRQFFCTETSLILGCVYFSVRLGIEPTWLNDRDQFLFPNDGWKADTVFQHDCLVFTLFHGQNRISTNDGTNHWIPFTEKEVQAKEKFASDFMSAFLTGMTFSPEAQAVLGAGRELWQYYHTAIKDIRSASVNASFYDIREFFQGRKETGTMNATSNDAAYNFLIKGLREKHRILAKKIEPKIYEYGFLKG